jgi:hypothetical protein
LQEVLQQHQQALLIVVGHALLLQGVVLIQQRWASASACGSGSKFDSPAGVLPETWPGNSG